MVQCENSACDEYQVPKEVGDGFDPATIVCGWCGQPVSSIEEQA